MAIANGNLYVALNYANKIAVISLNDHTVSYIETPAVTSYFVKDNDDNLYVSLVSSYTTSSSVAGLGFINTTTNTLDETFLLDGVSGGYGSIISANADFSTIYVIASAWVEDTPNNWVQKGAAYSFDVSQGIYNLFAGNLNGANGIVSNQNNNQVYILSSAGVTASGKIKIYDEDGTFVKDLQTGIEPAWALFID
jgi:hypothetical protein